MTSLNPAIVVPVLMCATVCVHSGFVWLGGLTPWKGGGFGMFSVVDSAAARSLSIVATTDDGSCYVVVIPANRFMSGPLSDLATGRVRVFPTASGLQSVGRAVLSRPLVPRGVRDAAARHGAAGTTCGRAEIGDPRADGSFPRARMLDVSVLRPRLNRNDLTVRYRVVATVRMAQSDDPR